MKIEELKSMTPEVTRQLKAMGIHSVESLAIRSIAEVKERLEKVSERKVKEVFEEAWRLKGFWFTTADKIDEIRGERNVYTSGSKALDEILGGGICSREITELAGEYGVGKSQMLYTIMVELLWREKDASVAFLDSEDTYRKERIVEMCTARGYQPEEILSRTIYIPIVDSNLFFEIIDRIDMTIENRNVKAILSDSLIAPLRAEYVGREVLWLRQQLLNKVLRRMLNLAKVYNIAVIVSNQVVASPQTFYTPNIIQQYPPTGGTIMAHNCNTRLYIRKAQGNRRIARLFDSSWRPEAEAVFMITEKGVVDVA